MPLYEYRCPSCDARVEVLQRVGDQPPNCGQCGVAMEKLVSSASLQFKGSGFYITDYPRGGASASEKGESAPPPTESKDQPAKTDSGETKAAPESKATPESKPAPEAKGTPASKKPKGSKT